jgi:hypothetical protein
MKTYIVLAILAGAATLAQAQDDTTGPDAATLVALPWKQFDQTLGSGWRIYADRGEHLAAARLIETYLARRSDLTLVQRAVSHFHAGAELARENLYEEALRHLEHAKVPPGTRGVPEDWNELVIATRAFLLGDREALLASKQRVEAMQSAAFAGSAAKLLQYLGQRYGAWDDEARSRKFPHYDRILVLDKTAATSANASIGDVNRDGHADIVIANGRHWPLRSRVFPGDGRGGFAAGYDLGEQPYRSYSAQLADMNGDGALDVVLGNDAPDAKLVYVNDGKGRFQASSRYGVPEWPTRNSTVADLNRDGLPDIVVANRSAEVGNFVCLNKGRGRFDSDCTAFSAESATTITAADLDRDGLIDLVVPHRDGGQSQVYLAGPAGTYSQSKRVAFGPPDATIRMTQAADFDLDGWVDLVAIDDVRRSVALHFGRKDGSFSSAVTIDNGNVVPYALATADLNRDGMIDIVVGNVAAPSTVFFNDGPGRHYTPVRFGDSEGVVFGFAIADLDGDGLGDIVAARSNAANVVYFATRP